MLIGSYNVKLTSKGRLATPSKFRSDIGEKAIVAKFYEGCLVLVSLPRWSELLDRLVSKTELITEPVRDTERFVLGSAFEIDLDSQGRFVVPPVLRDYARFKNEVVFLGLGDRVEIWDKELLNQRENSLNQRNSGGGEGND